MSYENVPLLHLGHNVQNLTVVSGLYVWLIYVFGAYTTKTCVSVAFPSYVGNVYSHQRNDPSPMCCRAKYWFMLHGIWPYVMVQNLKPCMPFL